jgi:hypothetical protein
MTDMNTAQMVVDLQDTDAAINAKGWVAPGLGVPGAPLGLLGSSLNPLTGLLSAGLGWFMPLVDFLGEPLTQLQGGNAGSVSSGSQDFGDAGQDMAGVADTYRQAASTQTSEWSGDAAAEYRNSAETHANGIAGLGQASNGVGSAIIGAGQVVAQAIAEVTELIAEAVAQIVPILTQAIARAGETFGQSVVEAIPPCVGIAIEYALRIAAKIAALLASGDNLMKLVQGGMAIVELIQQAMTSISGQSVSVEGQASVSAGGGQGGAAPMGAADIPEVAAGGSASRTPSSSGGGSGGGSGSGSGGGSSILDSGFASPGGPSSGSSSVPSGSSAPELSTRSSSVLPPQVHSGGGMSGSLGGGSGGGGFSPSASAGPVSMAAPALAPGAAVAGGRNADTTRQAQTGRPAAGQGASGGGAAGGVPMGGAMAGARPPGDGDKEHQRKVPLVQDHEEDIPLAAEVLEPQALEPVFVKPEVTERP